MKRLLALTTVATLSTMLAACGTPGSSNDNPRPRATRPQRRRPRRCPNKPDP
jgi:hypothetical protein